MAGSARQTHKFLKNTGTNNFLCPNFQARMHIVMLEQQDLPFKS